MVPFRESKLTSLFQNYFIGKGEGARKGIITMFVNVSNNASAFDETFHVLKFSALTSKVCTPRVSNVWSLAVASCMHELILNLGTINIWGGGGGGGDNTGSG